MYHTLILPGNFWFYTDVTAQQRKALMVNKTGSDDKEPSKDAHEKAIDELWKRIKQNDANVVIDHYDFCLLIQRIKFNDTNERTAFFNFLKNKPKALEYFIALLANKTMPSGTTIIIYGPIKDYCDKIDFITAARTVINTLLRENPKFVCSMFTIIPSIRKQLTSEQFLNALVASPGTVMATFKHPEFLNGLNLTAEHIDTLFKIALEYQKTPQKVIYISEPKKKKDIKSHAPETKTQDAKEAKEKSVVLVSDRDAKDAKIATKSESKAQDTRKEEKKSAALDDKEPIREEKEGYDPHYFFGLFILLATHFEPPILNYRLFHLLVANSPAEDEPEAIGSAHMQTSPEQKHQGAEGDAKQEMKITRTTDEKPLSDEETQIIENFRKHLYQEKQDAALTHLFRTHPDFFYALAENASEEDFANLLNKIKNPLEFFTKEIKRSPKVLKLCAKHIILIALCCVTDERNRTGIEWFFNSIYNSDTLINCLKNTFNDLVAEATTVHDHINTIANILCRPLLREMLAVESDTRLLEALTSPPISNHPSGFIIGYHLATDKKIWEVLAKNNFYFLNCLARDHIAELNTRYPSVNGQRVQNHDAKKENLDGKDFLWARWQLERYGHYQLVAAGIRRQSFNTALAMLIALDSEPNWQKVQGDRTWNIALGNLHPTFKDRLRGKQISFPLETKEPNALQLPLNVRQHQQDGTPSTKASTLNLEGTPNGMVHAATSSTLALSGRKPREDKFTTPTRQAGATVTVAANPDSAKSQRSVASSLALGAPDSPAQVGVAAAAVARIKTLRAGPQTNAATASSTTNGTESKHETKQDGKHGAAAAVAGTDTEASIGADITYTL